MRNEAVEFHEGPGIEQFRDALTRGELAGFVLTGDALGASAGFGTGPPRAKFLEGLGHSGLRGLGKDADRDDRVLEE